MKEFWRDGIDFGEFDQRILIIPGLFVFIAFVRFFRNDIAHQFNSYEQNKTRLKEDYENSFSGKIVKKGDGSHRYEVYFQLSDSSKIVDWDAWEKVAIGDSVVKKPNSYLLFIHRKSNIIEMDYLQLFKERDSLMRNGKW